MKSAKQILIAAVTLIIFLLLTIWRYSGKTSLLPPSLQPSFGAFQGPNSTLTERLLLPGTPEETPLYIIASPVEGPTVLVIGGFTATSLPVTWRQRRLFPGRLTGEAFGYTQSQCPGH